MQGLFENLEQEITGKIYDFHKSNIGDNPEDLISNLSGANLEDLISNLSEAIRACAIRTREKQFTDAIWVLNSALKADPEAVTDMVLHRIPGREKLYPDAGIHLKMDLKEGVSTFSVLGLINAVLMARDPDLKVSAVLNQEGKITHFQNLREVISA